MSRHINKVNCVFTLKLKLSNITCALLAASVASIMSILLFIYNEIVYVGERIPPELLLPLLVVAGVLSHISYVAFKGLLKGVSSN